MRRSHRLALTAGIVLAAAGVGGGVVLSAAAHRRAPAAGTADVATTAGAPALASTRAREASASDALALAGHPAGAGRAADTELERRVAKLAGGVPRVVLDAPQVALGSALAVAGHDRAAPRALELWRIAGDRAARVALGRSVAGGALAFPALVLPAGDVTLVASPEGSGPTGPGASSPATVRRDPSAPRVVAVEAAEHALALHVVPAEPDGEIVVIAASGAHEVERARVAVVADADGMPAALDVALALGTGDREISVAQVLPDGRCSPLRFVSLPTPTLENLDAESIAVAP